MGFVSPLSEGLSAVYADKLPSKPSPHRTWVARPAVLRAGETLGEEVLQTFCPIEFRERLTVDTENSELSPGSCKG